MPLKCVRLVKNIFDELSQFRLRIALPFGEQRPQDCLELILDLPRLLFDLSVLDELIVLLVKQQF